MGIKRTTIKPFDRAMSKLPDGAVPIVEKVIMEKCGIRKRQNFNSIKKGREGINPERMDVIEYTFKCWGLDAWTGEPIAANN